ncbi:iron-containing redox enzyme family protein [Tumebacillus sp. DT12]|uniref:Aminopyrimidine aminohydrolase n=1 Tax=Tumebacillus lacus TaxID=2995335 RepID=A0ABT3WXD4_9BACL|nr:iron-containing redox enzyme family protein [Tumebacillus lacus]MCX7569338.1 iron-containing redox enzyme family protein [Tumebacillus lacus]
MSTLSTAKGYLGKPRLRHCTFVIRNDKESIFLVFGKDYFEIGKDVGDPRKFMELKRYMDGRHTIPQIAEHTGVNEESVRDIVAMMDEMGMFREELPLDRIKKEDFLRAIDDTAVMWSRQIGYHQLFAGLERNEYPKEVFHGLLLETYQYVKSATRHISNALAHCRDEHHEKILTDYFLDEYNHTDLILQTLENVGIPREVAQTANPLVGTTALIQMLCEIGRQSSLAYIACTSLFEARQEDYATAQASFEKISGNFGHIPDTIEPILQHMRGDIEGGHQSLIERALEHVEYIEAKEAHFVINCVHDLKHAFDLYHDNIISYYNDPASYIPRLYVDYFSL